MLVLSRRVGEAVCVGPGVTIRVIESKGSRVRLAIDAPAEVRISRSELPPRDREGVGPLVASGR
jgi:carbon storage regulator